MKRILTLLLAAAVCAAQTGCKYDDSELRDSVAGLDQRLKNLEKTVSEMNSEVSALQTLVETLDDGKGIASVEHSADGYTIVLSDGERLTVKHGKPGSNAPVIGVKQFEGVYYWTTTADGQERWLPDSDTPQLPVSGHTPRIGVDSEGYWTVDGSRMEIGGQPVLAEGRDGDSFFDKVEVTSGAVTFILKGGETFTLPLSGASSGPDYSDPDGVFLLNEGNMSTQDGTIVWYDGQLNEYRNIYENANQGRTPGNVLQDMFIAGDKAYFICQNGTVRGGDGQLLECDLKTMKLLRAYSGLDFDRHDTHDGFPQHIVVAAGKVFIQYASDMAESHSGIRVLNLASGALRADDIEGTYGTFAYGTDENPMGGALKARMLYSRGRVIAALAKGLVFIDPVTERVIKSIAFTGGVKDVVKGADGNLYVAVTGDFTTPQGYNDYNSPTGSKMYAYTPDGQQISVTELDGITFTTAPWVSNIGMSADFSAPHLYFRPDMFNWSTFMSGDVIARYDYSTGEVVKDFVQPAMMTEVYGYTGVHPTQKRLFTCVNNIGVTMVTGMHVYDISDPDTPKADKSFTLRNHTGSPAGIYFTHSFSRDYHKR